jgi:hypothetical protein
MDIKEVGIPLDALPENLRGILAPDAAEARKMIVARAAIPMPPDVLLPALAFLTSEKSAELRDAARKSLDELPRGTVLPVLRSHETAGPVLDRLARIYMRDDECLQQILLNRSALDDTFVFIARYSEGRPLEAIALNQERLSRCPAIVQGIYYNPKAKMSTVSVVMEYAVRENLPIQHMPGYKEIVAAVYGDARLERPAEGDEAASVAAQAEAAKAPEPAAEGERPPVAGTSPEKSLSAEELLEQAFGDGDIDGEEDDIEMFQSESDLMDEFLGEHAVDEEDDFGDFLGEGSSPGLEDESDDAFFAVLSAAMQDDGGEGAEEKESAFIADRIKDMNVSERVRVALMGNGSARKILIADSNKLVSSAVMRNPGINDREVLDFAGNKNLSADVLRLIATGRTWTRNYTVKKALIVNPKTPPAFAIGFLKHLRDKDLKDVARNRDVSPTITRIAKRIISERTQKK